jgi:hypothetical protein
MYANSEKQEETQQHSAAKHRPKCLTETHKKALSRTQRKRAINSAKPLFVGSIPTAAFNLLNDLQAPHKLPEG